MISIYKRKILYVVAVIELFFGFSCKKLVEIPHPNNSITTQQVFSTDLEAEEAVSGIYLGMINNGNAFSSSITIFAGASADEFNFFNLGNSTATQFQNNALLSTNGINDGNFWAQIYSTIYGCNSVIGGLAATSAVHDSVKNELVGETEFVRAFANFYLINLYGNVPLVNSINYSKTSLLPNSTITDLYSAVESDLNDAISRLPSDYSAGHGQRIVPNKWAAVALLARVYLYNGNWSQAEKEATSIINNSIQYSLVSDLNSVFLTNSSEAIWQLQQPNNSGTYLDATPEGYTIVPATNTSIAFYDIRPTLLSNFEKGDQRRYAWVDSTNYLGTTYYYPYKYKIGATQAVYNGVETEYYMVLRLAEQYLIRAEAETELGDYADAATDLNTIRKRAGLPITTATGKDDMLAAIAHENQIEFFAEWGHRWLDLKRTGKAVTVLSVEKGGKVDSHDLLYPIPISEIRIDPNLRQNPGY